MRSRNSIRRQKALDWVHVRHEEVAAFAAGAEAQLTGQLAVCAGSCGPGNLHLINGLYDCHRSNAPVLAIAAHIPSAEIGSSYFQETHPEQLFRECSHYCEMVSHPAQMPRVLEIAIREAIGKRGVSVVVIPGDVALQAAQGPAAPASCDYTPRPPNIIPTSEDLKAAGEAAQRWPQGYPVLRRRVRGRARASDRAGGQAEGADRPCDARQRACRMGQSLRRRHDRTDRLFLRLFRDGGLRHLAAARYEFPVHAILSVGREGRAGRCPAREISAARVGSTSASSGTSARRSQRCCRCLPERRNPKSSRPGAQATMPGRASCSTSWRGDRPASRQSIRNTSRASSASLPATKLSLRATSANPPSGPLAT